MTLPQFLKEHLQLTAEEIVACKDGVTPEVQEKINRMVARLKAKIKDEPLQ